MTEIYSYTSNVTKLLKHLDTLKNLQNGHVCPIMVHVIPTHRCQLNCLHCCFKNRKNRKADLPIKDFKTAVKSFFHLGTKAIEFTGGGDPVLWPYINEGVEFLRNGYFHIGIITNGIGANLVDDWNLFDWVRVSLNTLDYKENIDLSKIKKTNVKLSFCYIWNDLSESNIKKIIDFSNKHEIVCRLAPDCIKPLDVIEKSIVHIREILKTFKDNKYVLLSDFNIDTIRPNIDCRIHMIKPCLYLDGYLYACPSAELAIENDRQIADKTRICNINNIYKFYTSKDALEAKKFDCSYCKYVKQQAILEALLMKTEFNEFA